MHLCEPEPLFLCGLLDVVRVAFVSGVRAAFDVGRVREDLVVVVIVPVEVRVIGRLLGLLGRRGKRGLKEVGRNGVKSALYPFARVLGPIISPFSSLPTFSS
jgi:hypothetical protein